MTKDSLESVSLQQRLRNLEKEMMRCGYTARELRMLERSGCVQLRLDFEKEECEPYVTRNRI